MSRRHRELILFGPQRLDPILCPELRRLGVDKDGGPVASITAGWQEREGELEALQSHLDCEVEDLGLHRRCDQVFDEDQELFRAHRARQDRLQEIQRLHRMRLDYALEPARRLLRETGDASVIDPQRKSAIDAVRRLDYDHLLHLAEVHEEFEARWRPAERDAVVRQRLEIAAILARAEALVIAGGHVAVLVNRLRLFSLVDLFGNLPILAWSAGAMALGERIVLFHDTPPQGAGNPEVLDMGLGLHQDLIPLPAASQRLRLDDPVRVSLFARRFAPDLCVPLDAGMSVHFEDRRWLPGQDSRVLTADGRVVPLDQELAA